MIDNARLADVDVPPVLLPPAPRVWIFVDEDDDAVWTGEWELAAPPGDLLDTRATPPDSRPLWRVYVRPARSPIAG